MAIAFTTDPIFAVRYLCDFPHPVPNNPHIKRAVVGEEENCSSSTKFFLIETDQDISPQALEELRQDLRKRLNCKPTGVGQTK